MYLTIHDTIRHTIQKSGQTIHDTSPNLTTVIYSMILKWYDTTTCIHCHQSLEDVMNIVELIHFKKDKDRTSHDTLVWKKNLSLAWFLSNKMQKYIWFI